MSVIHRLTRTLLLAASAAVIIVGVGACARIAWELFAWGWDWNLFE